MHHSTAILRYLSHGPATADALSQALNLTLGCIATETDQLIKSGQVYTGTIAMKNKPTVSTYRISPKALLELADKTSK